MSTVLAWMSRRFKMPRMVVWMLLSAALFLVSAAYASYAGAVLLAKIGIAGTIAALAFIAIFS